MHKILICVGILTIASGVINSQVIVSSTDDRLPILYKYKYIITDLYYSVGDD